MKIAAVVTLLAAVAACAPNATPTPYEVGTLVAQAAIELLTQTAAAASPTPTATLTPSPSDTPTVTVEPTSSDDVRMPVTLSYAPCWFGPGPSYPLESNISEGKDVELLGVGSVPGWYVIRNPYFHAPCWIQAADLQIFEGTDLTTLPVIKPGGP